MSQKYSASVSLLITGTYVPNETLTPDHTYRNRRHRLYARPALTDDLLELRRSRDLVARKALTEVL